MSNSYSSTHDFESKLVPNLKYVLKKISQGRRIELSLKLAVSEAKEQAIYRELNPLIDKMKEADEAAALEPCQCEHTAEEHHESTKRCTVDGCECRKPLYEDGIFERAVELTNQSRALVFTDFHPIYVRWGIKSIEGLEIDGAPATVDSLLDDGPEPLVKEVAEEIVRLTRMSAEETLAFKSPTISDVLTMDGPVQSTNAETVKP
jgi:hypothetical protein